MKIYKTDNGRPPFKNRFSVITQQPSRLSNFSEILRWVAVFRRISEMEQIPAFHSKSVVTAIGFTAGDQYLLNARE